MILIIIVYYLFTVSILVSYTSHYYSVDFFYQVLSTDPSTYPSTYQLKTISKYQPGTENSLFTCF